MIPALAAVPAQPPGPPAARGLFLLGGPTPVPDAMVCSGQLPAALGGRPCPRSDRGRMPAPAPLDPGAQTYTIDKGQPGDLCPPCCWESLGHVGHWQGHGGDLYPDELLPLRLFKCALGFWVVVPGLRDDAPATLQVA